MTFYWWSHWFWITTWSTILLSITIVHTYPSQEISLEYNENSKSVKAVTKLHQTTRSLDWSTTTTTAITKVTTPTTKDAKKDNVVQQQDNEKKAEEASEELANEEQTRTLQSTNRVMKPAADAVEEENNIEADNKSSDGQLEYKRSAEVGNKTVKVDGEEEDASDENVMEEPHVAAVMVQSRSASVDEEPLKLNRYDDETLSNYTNYSRNAIEARSNKTFENYKSTTHAFNSTTTSSPTDSQAAYSSRAASVWTNSSPKNTVAAKSRSDNLEWLNKMAVVAALPPSKLLTHPPQSTDLPIERDVLSVTAHPSSSAAATAAGALVVAPGAVGTATMLTTSQHQQQQQQQQRIPFTLENANKEEELRRAENEHRSRKSKVLSAEYKHINRFINYSGDAKSVLTRSALAARTGFDGGEENNISSEALSIQRAHFMDAGAISAVCVSIFGVCCTVGTIGIVLYRRRYVNKPQALSEPDSSVYIDDSTMRDNSDEMYSLDNDSFLNSLEAMTIQNYWTDTVKHTKL